MDDEQSRALRSLPSVTSLLTDEGVAESGSELLPSAVTAVVRRALDDARRDVLGGRLEAGTGIASRVARELD
ncbi:MAG: hypothetical protein M3439_09820, partial [Chloroflexota bacterium]|nr:hypothetical protein [Chloroflexota bacterium]